jgi:TonB family protein
VQEQIFISTCIVLLALLASSCKETNPTEPHERTLILTDSIAYYSDDDLTIKYGFDADAILYSDIVPPQAVNTVSATYPMSALTSGWQGDVFVDALVMKDGSVKRAIIRYSTDIIFDKPFLEATMKWTFTPATYCGDAINAWFRIFFNYRLR